MTTDDDDDDDDTVSDNFISFSHIPYKTTCIQNSINKQSNKQEFAWRFLSLTHTLTFVRKPWCTRKPKSTNIKMKTKNKQN